MKNVTQKIFGSKFHITFPNHRRRQDSTCGVGVWPTNQNEKYQTIGVDVQVTEYSDVSYCFDIFENKEAFFFFYNVNKICLLSIAIK